MRSVESLWTTVLRLCAVAFLLWSVAACSSPMPAGATQAESATTTPTELHEWQIIDVKSGQEVTFNLLVNELASQDVIYLGEEHYNRHHVDAAIRVLEVLQADGRRPIMTMEMFGWDGQDALDYYISQPDVTREQFLDDVRWEENWGGDFEDYEPLLRFAREHNLPVVAMNPPRPLVQKVARQGLTQALNDPDMERWGMKNEPIVDDPAYREVLMRQLRQCHGGMPDSAYERIYEASMFRDEGMAKTISIVLRSEGIHHIPDGRQRGPVVSYTGGGHIQRTLPVPKRVQRRQGGSIRQVTIYMASLEPDHPEYIQNLLEEKVADYVWLTPLSEHGPPARCG